MQREPSRTAQHVALQRAVHQWIDGLPKILTDPVAPRLFPAEVMADVYAHPEPFRTWRSLGLRSHVLIRSRYAEDCLQDAVAHGVSHYLILGAGWDTFAYRQPAWDQGLKIFEVDHPASQRAKLQQLHAAGIPVPPNVEYVPIDFEIMSLREGLQRSSFDFSNPVFISWLGVLVYLSQEAIDAVFHVVASLPASSEIVLTFASPPSHPFAHATRRIDEPRITYFRPEEMLAYLQRWGFSAITIPTPDEIATRYIHQRHDGLFAPLRKALARVQIVEK